MRLLRCIDTCHIVMTLAQNLFENIIVLYYSTHIFKFALMNEDL